MTARGTRLRPLAIVLVLGAVLLTSGCGWVSNLFSSNKEKGSTTVSVFDVKIGQCFNPPAEVKAELGDLTAIPCATAHTQEAYAKPDYQPPAGVDGSIYPGDAALATFAQGACADAFTGYVGVSYLDSSLYFTYLTPSARSWEQGKDRTVICFALTTGAPLTASVKNSKL